MVKCAKGNRNVFLALTIYLFFILTISSGCKKKEQPEEARQDVPAEEITRTSISEQVVQTVASEKIDLRILFVGPPDNERTKDFIDFLTKNFEKVVTIGKKAFNEDKTAEFDVIVLDETIRIKREYLRPTVTIGNAGTRVGDYLDLKTGYL